MIQNIKDIWAKVRDGDPAAWRSVVERYSALVYTVAMRTGLSEFDAEDCAQHAWMALYRNRRAIRDPARLPVWLIRTTRREAVRMIRRRMRQNQFADDPVDVPSPTLPDDEMLRLERQAILEIGLGRLDERCRKILRALFLAPEDKSYAEIARSAGVKPNTFGPLRSRCLNRLRKILQELGYEWD